MDYEPKRVSESEIELPLCMQWDQEGMRERERVRETRKGRREMVSVLRNIVALLIAITYFE